MQENIYKYRFVIGYFRRENMFMVTKRTDADWCDKSLYFFNREHAEAYFRKNIKAFAEVHEREKADGIQKMFLFVTNEENPDIDTFIY